MKHYSKIILILGVVCLALAIYKRSYVKELLYPWTYPLEGCEKLDILDKTTLEKGEKILNQQRAIICGISRDNANDFFVMRRHIEYLGEQFKDYRVVIFENDSKDRTKDLLASWSKKNQNVTIISKDFKNKKRPSIQFLADARNFYIDEIQKPDYDDFNVLIVVDMDMSYGFDMRGIYHSFASWDSWDAMASNGVSNSEGEMYDAFAFRNSEFPWAHYQKPKTYWEEIVPKIQRVYPVTSALVPVDSAFGGLAIYKRDKLKGCRYQSIMGDCEHIEFHKCLKQNKGIMFMNPAQYIKYSHYKK